MSTYLDQIGRQEFIRQHLDKITTASAPTSAAHRPGNQIQFIAHTNILTEKTNSRLVFPRFNRSLTSLVQSLLG